MPLHHRTTAARDFEKSCDWRDIAPAERLRQTQSAIPVRAYAASPRAAGCPGRAASRSKLCHDRIADLIPRVASWQVCPARRWTTVLDRSCPQMPHISRANWQHMSRSSRSEPISPSIGTSQPRATLEGKKESPIPREGTARPNRARFSNARVLFPEQWRNGVTGTFSAFLERVCRTKKQCLPGTVNPHVSTTSCCGPRIAPVNRSAARAFPAPPERESAPLRVRPHRVRTRPRHRPLRESSETSRQSEVLRRVDQWPGTSIGRHPE